MDLDLKTLVSLTYLVPIAVTLRKVYAPSFEIPDAFLATLAKLDTTRTSHRYIGRFRGAPAESRVSF